MGLAVADFNGDGHLDILKTHFADDTPALYRGQGKGQFDHDGLPDIFCREPATCIRIRNVNSRPIPTLLRRYCFGIWAVDASSNSAPTRVRRWRSGIPHEAWNEPPSLLRNVLSQTSFTSASDLRLHFGLGDGDAAEVTVRWPTGVSERFAVAAVDRVLRLAEGAGAQ